MTTRENLWVCGADQGLPTISTQSFNFRMDNLSLEPWTRRLMATYTFNDHEEFWIHQRQQLGFVH